MQPERSALEGGRQASTSAAPTGIELTEWQMARTDPGSVTHPDQLPVADECWTAASAPGTVAGALRAAGKWDWAAPLAIDGYDWWYRCQFRCDARIVVDRGVRLPSGARRPT